MKSMKITKLLGIALIISLLIVAIPASPALGAYDIVLTPASGQIGASITITGANFPASTLIYFCFSNQSKLINQYIGTDVTVYSTVASTTTTTSGTLSTSFTVPTKFSTNNADVTSGPHYLYATVFTADIPPKQLIVNVINFSVVGGEISISPLSGTVDSTITITGDNFATSQAISILFGGAAVPIESGSTATDAYGDFISTILVPENKAGVHDITVTVAGYPATAQFTIEPDVIIFPQSGGVGDTVSISGTGFARRPKLVDIYFNNIFIQSAQTDTLGSFYLPAFEIPDFDLLQGSYFIDAEDEDLNLARASFTLNVVTPTTTPPTTTPPTTTPPDDTDLNINFDTNHIGSSIAIGGSGFTPNGTATILFDDLVLTTLIIGANGTFLVSVNVPPVRGGPHTITVNDDGNTNQVTYTVETTPPSTSTPQLPANGSKVSSPITFEWVEIDDVSEPVKYNLQVSSDSSFGANSIVLQKTELESPEYTLTEQEELALAGKETPYYWRVKAIDAASNESAWSSLSEFYVSLPFSFPTWAIIVLSIFGALLFFGLGYWLGRRTAFFY
jgi:hypothetical protein